MFLSQANEILYGGAAGGGKSHLLRIASIYFCGLVPKIQVYLFRRLSDDLYKNHMEGEGGFYSLLESLFENKWVKYNAKRNFLEYKNGAKTYLCHCLNEDKLKKYQGPDINVLLMDEVTHFTEHMYRFLRGRVRLGGLKVPPALVNKLPLIICGTNPGDVGHVWVKRTFVDFAPPFDITRTPKKEGNKLRQFIPAKLEDNPTLMENDPNYEYSLEALGSPELVKAMREGDWNIVAGGALNDVWSTPVHVIKPFRVPSNWPVFRALDWGSAKPFSVGWYAVANGEEVTRYDGSVFCPQPGSKIRFYEWYGSEVIGSNKGIKLTSKEVAKGVKKIDKYLLTEGVIQNKVVPGPADSQIYSVTDTQSDSIAQNMESEDIYWYPADKRAGSRVNGLELVRNLLGNAVKGEGPGLYFTNNCVNAIATLPNIARDKFKLEDVDTESEDHIYDEVRYMCSHKPKEYASSKDVDILFP